MGQAVKGPPIPGPLQRQGQHHGYPVTIQGFSRERDLRGTKPLTESGCVEAIAAVMGPQGGRSVLGLAGRSRVTAHTLFPARCLCLDSHSEWVVTELVSSSHVHDDPDTVSDSMNRVVKR